MFGDWMGTIGFALLLLVIVLAMLRVVKWSLRELDDWKEYERLAPHEVADALGRLSDAERPVFRGKLPTLTDRERQEAKARLYLVRARERGRARVATFPIPPKGAA